MTLALVHFHSVGLIGRFDPRWKLAAIGLATLAVALLRTLSAASIAFVATCLLVLLAGFAWSWYGRRLVTLAVFLVPFVVWIPWLVPGEGWDIGPIHLSLPGLALSGVIVLKAFTIVTLMLVLWATAPVESTLRAAHWLRAPGLTVQLMVLTYRYMHLLGEEFARLRIALRVRGYRNRPNLHSYRTVGHVTAALLLRSYERAERVGQAMRCRGFDGCYRCLAEFHTRLADVAGFCAITFTAAGLLIWDLLSK
jgi:cobalt/nickel transport system permease protein